MDVKAEVPHFWKRRRKRRCGFVPTLLLAPIIFNLLLLLRQPFSTHATPFVPVLRFVMLNVTRQISTRPRPTFLKWIFRGLSWIPRIITGWAGSFFIHNSLGRLHLMKLKLMPLKFIPPDAEIIDHALTSSGTIWMFNRNAKRSNWWASNRPIGKYSLWEDPSNNLWLSCIGFYYIIHT